MSDTGMQIQHISQAEAEAAAILQTFRNTAADAKGAKELDKAFTAALNQLLPLIRATCCLGAKGAMEMK